MDNKATKLMNAANKLKLKKITLYHVFAPVSDEQFNEIKQSGYWQPSQNALGGQSNGYYFFTTYTGATHHIKTMQNTWDYRQNKNAYIAECEVDLNDVKYPAWKLDYEAMQDYMFDMIYNTAAISPISFDGIKINATDKKTLSISQNGKFSRIKNFCANDHSGLIEKISDFLYKTNPDFKEKYDNLLTDVLMGHGQDQEIYAIKTTNRQKISKLSKIEKPDTTINTPNNSQISKFLSRYKNNKNK